MHLHVTLHNGRVVNFEFRHEYDAAATEDLTVTLQQACFYILTKKSRFVISNVILGSYEILHL